MPNIASAKKNMRKSRAAQARNRAQRSALRTALKKAKGEGASAEVQTAAVTLLDRAARKGLIPPQVASRQAGRCKGLSSTLHEGRPGLAPDLNAKCERRHMPASGHVSPFAFRIALSYIAASSPPHRSQYHSVG